MICIRNTPSLFSEMGLSFPTGIPDNQYQPLYQYVNIAEVRAASCCSVNRARQAILMNDKHGKLWLFTTKFH